nr:hypothetical protein [Actinomycetota bacterium]
HVIGMSKHELFSALNVWLGFTTRGLRQETDDFGLISGLVEAAWGIGPSRWEKRHRPAKAIARNDHSLR